MEVPLAVILGSGLSSAAAPFPVDERIPFAAFPGLGMATVEGHRGEFTRCRVGTERCWFVHGRRHRYEGDDEAVARLVGAVSSLGARRLLLTSAAGSLTRRLPPGRLVLIESIMDFQPRTRRSDLSPVTGLDAVRDRMPMGRLSPDAGFTAEVRSAAAGAGIELEKGVAACVIGPAYETKSEVIFLQSVGASVVTMSGGAEIAAAQRTGIRTAWIVLVTNYATGICEGQLRHSDVLACGQRSGEAFGRLFVPLAETTGTPRD